MQRLSLTELHCLGETLWQEIITAAKLLLMDLQKWCSSSRKKGGTEPPDCGFILLLVMVVGLIFNTKRNETSFCIAFYLCGTCSGDKDQFNDALPHWKYDNVKQYEMPAGLVFDQEKSTWLDCECKFQVCDGFHRVRVSIFNVSSSLYACLFVTPLHDFHIFRLLRNWKQWAGLFCQKMCWCLCWTVNCLQLLSLLCRKQQTRLITISAPLPCGTKLICL